MKRDLFLATFSTNALEVIKKNNIGIEFNQFCLSVSLDEKNIGKVTRAMKEELVTTGITDESGVTDYSKVFCHGPFTEVCPQAIDHLAVDLSRLRLDQAYEGANKVGARRMVVHSGLIPQIYFPEWHVKQSVKFWREYMEDKPDDYIIYIENVLDPEPEPLLEIAEGVGDPRVKLCLDVGHANAAGKGDFGNNEGLSGTEKILKWIKILGPHLGHFHLHNNDGTADQHRPVMDGEMDMERILDAIDDYCDPGATITVESRDCESSIPWLLERLV